MGKAAWQVRGRGLMAAAAIGISTPVAAELVLYEHDDYRGRSFTAAGRTANLDPLRFNDLASSVVVRSGQWQLCDDAEFRGQCVVLGPGSYPALRPMGLNDRISSVREVAPTAGAGSGWGGGTAAIELYEHDDYAGRRLGASASKANLSREGFNDLASSLVIRSGRWEVCSDADFRGRCVTLGPGSYRRLRDFELNDMVSSLRPGDGRPAGQVPSDDGSPPELAFGQNQAGRALYLNGCIVYYNAAGQRFQNLPTCGGDQVRRADEAMARHRASQGLDRSDSEHPWATRRMPGFGRIDTEPPEIVMGLNREGEVVFRNNCVAYYDALGRRWRQQPTCSGPQLRQADQAMAAYRREQGY